VAWELVAGRVLRLAGEGAGATPHAGTAREHGRASPQGGASTILVYPIANAFLRAFGVGSGELAGTSLVAAALTAAARRDRPLADSLLRQALDCCAAELGSIGDDDRLRIFGESEDPRVRSLGHEAGRRLVTAFPNDLMIQFSLGMAYGRVRPALRISGSHADQAVAVFEGILATGRPMPNWMEAWSSYLVAERIAERDPARAKTLAQRALATNVDTDGLRARVTGLLRRLP
jgi:hypothetical protein